jgi:hypothetical protein
MRLMIFPILPDSVRYGVRDHAPYIPAGDRVFHRDLRTYFHLEGKRPLGSAIPAAHAVALPIGVDRRVDRHAFSRHLAEWAWRDPGAHPHFLVKVFVRQRFPGSFPVLYLILW